MQFALHEVPKSPRREGTRTPLPAKVASVAYVGVACSHLSIEQDAVPTDLIDPKSVCCPLLCHGNHPNETNKNYPQSEFMADKMNETVEYGHVMRSFFTDGCINK